MAKKKSDTSETPAPSPATASVEATPAPTPTAETSAPAAAGTETESNKRRGRQPGISPRRGKKLRALLKNQQSKIAKTGPLPLKEALKLVKSLKRAKFDETIEVHMHLGIDPTQADQMIRGSIPLPFGLGKEKKVLVFCQGENLAKAKEAGADFVGGDDLIKKIQSENWMDFDVALATQDMMGMVSRLGKVLGPRGLMPTP
ncbi:MAG: 50S ribosomal protein L1, partial [Gemmataceae bacterium]